jgi:hypothetical protein
MCPADGTLLYSMDPGLSVGAEYGSAANAVSISADDLFTLLQQNFNDSYNGNRSPFGLYVHTPWAVNSSVQATNQFLDWALGLNDTYVVTMRQVIEWMQVGRSQSCTCAAGTAWVAASVCVCVCVCVQPSHGWDVEERQRQRPEYFEPACLPTCTCQPQASPYIALCASCAPPRRTLCPSARWMPG